MSDIMEGVRILEVAEHTFVPAASAILADWGAEVIKVEHPERGDAMRGLASSGVMPSMGAVHVLLEHSNRGKKSIGIDVSTPQGLDLIYRLAATCDVFLTNKVPAVRKKLHIELEDIKAHNSNIIYVAGTGAGERGPEADRGGYDFLSYWCRAGSAMGTTPTDVDYLAGQPGPGYGDSIGGMTIAGGILGALFHRERTGEALPLDVSLLGVGMWAMSPAIALSLQLDMPWRPGPSKGGGINLPNPLVGTYLTQDNRFLAFSCLQGFRYWPSACRVIGREELITDERFSTHEQLAANAAAARAILKETFESAPLSEWRERLAAFEGQWAVAQDSIEVTKDVQVEANGYLGRDRHRRRHALHPRDDTGAVRRRAGRAQAVTRVQRALRGDPRRHQLQRGRDDRAQSGRGAGVDQMSEPRTTALLFVECQRGVIGDLSVLPALAEAAQPALGAMARLASGARGAGVQVVHLTYLPLAGGRSASQRAPLMRATSSTAAWKESDAPLEIVPEIGVGPRRPAASPPPGDLPRPPHRGHVDPAQHGHGRHRGRRRVDEPGRPAGGRGRRRRGLRRHGGHRRHGRHPARAPRVHAPAQPCLRGPPRHN